jgi:AraC-like DNA-binding protein
MAEKRHWAVRAYTAAPTDYPGPRHWHRWDQLTSAASGALRVNADSEQWLVPSGRGIWIPAHTPHAEHVCGRAVLHTLYLPARLVRSLPRRCTIVDVSPLARELVAHIGRIGELHHRTAAHARLFGVLIDQLTPASVPQLHMPEPRDRRARQVAALLRRTPDTRASIGALARAAGSSARTIERLFLAETKMTIGDWRRQLRLLHGVTLLAAGSAVGVAARKAGYTSASAFIAAFRKRFGTTPARY